jgi:hypothetical protein
MTEHDRRQLLDRADRLADTADQLATVPSRRREAIELHRTADQLRAEADAVAVTIEAGDGLDLVDDLDTPIALAPTPAARLRMYGPILSAWFE